MPSVSELDRDGSQPVDAARPTIATACPDEATVQALLERRLAADEAARVQTHLDGCSTCRRWLAAAAHAVLEPDPDRQSDDGLRSRGAEFGRYVVLDVIGRGGMGTVFSAWDPELDRRIALKLLRDDRSLRDEDRRRLQREAQAMAKLAHPNVVAVHDVGTLDGEVFIAMEFVEGATLRQWQRERARPWREILCTYLMAGEGLAAAHRVGLVHRDFKPDNVLVGHDGRARVADFGLARAGRFAEELESRPSDSETSALAGTPAYMAPEQRIGDAVDARADQFAFCRAMQEALASCASDRAPKWLHAVLRRGQAHAPEARWPAMATLLGELRREPARRWRRLALGGSAATSTMAVITAMRVGSTPCDDLDDGREQPWDPRELAALQARIAEDPRADATAIAARVVGEFESYATAWVDMRTDACLAHRVRDEQSAALYDQRMVCLDRRRSAVAAFVGAVTEAETLPLHELVPAALGLPRIADCADLERLAEVLPLPGDQAARDGLAAATDTLERAWIDRYLFGDSGSLMGPVSSVYEAASNLHYPPLQAKAASLLADLQQDAGDFAAAHRTLQDGLIAATAGHDDRTAGVLAIKVAALLGIEQRRFAEAETAVRFAEALLARGPSPAEDQAGLRSVRALLARLQGDPEGALALHREALALIDGASGATPGERAGERSNYAATLMALDRHAEAARVLDEAVALVQTELGDRHPVVAAILQNQALALAGAGDLERALELTERARSLFALAYGADDRRVGDVLRNLAVFETELGRTTAAREHARKALEILENALGHEHPMVGETLTALGIAERSLGACGAARDAFTRAIAITTAGDDAAESQRIAALAALPCESAIP